MIGKKISEKEYLSLLQEIRTHDRAYFIETHPIISDYEYDQLVKKVEEIEKEHPEWISPDSPTQRVGETATKGFGQIQHEIPMLSLANTYSQKELEDFFKRIHKWTQETDIEFCAELKMDGVAVTVRYERGVYHRALTRGDGKKGDDITANLKTISQLPLRLNLENPPEVLEIRGEVFMSHKAFHHSNQKKEDTGEAPWANPRNAAAGSLKLLDPKEVKQRRLSIIFYGIAQDSSHENQSQLASHQFLENIGLPTFSKKHRIKAKKIEEILTFAKEIEKERQFLGFDIDGIVVKVDDFSLRDEIGTTGKSPRWAVAYKFAPEQATTVIREITVQVGRTGILTPVAELEPVFLAGSKISRATLHNREEIERKDIRVGDVVVIEKGGDVIPKVVEVKISQRSVNSVPWKAPTHCPICQSLIVHKEGEVAIRCLNSECADQVLRRISHFSSKNAMDIEHMGPRVVEQLVEKGLVKTFADIYALTKEEVALLDGFKEKSILNLLKSIEKSKKTTLSRLIFALGIKHVGEGIAELIAHRSGDMEAVLQFSFDDLAQIEGIGEKVAESIVTFFQNPENIKEIHRLFHLGVTPEKVKTQKGHPFFGKTFVLTGTLENYSRSKASALIKERGGKVTNSVGKKVDYLLLGKDPGSKAEKAKKINIAILSEEEFTNLLR